MSIIFRWNEDCLIMGHNKLEVQSVSAGIMHIYAYLRTLFKNLCHKYTGRKNGYKKYN